VQVLKFYKKCLKKKFFNPSVEIPTSIIVELLAENPSPMEINSLTAATSKK